MQFEPADPDPDMYSDTYLDPDPYLNRNRIKPYGSKAAASKGQTIDG